MKKVFKWISALFGGKLKDYAIDSAGDELDEFMEKSYEKDPETTTAAVQSLYALTPILGKLAAKTETDIDDKVVAELQKEIAEFAASKGIELPAQATASDLTPDPGGEHPTDPPPNG